MTNELDSIFMRQALALARKAAKLNEVPIGAVITCNNVVVAEAFNLKESTQNPIGHAEILAIQEASLLKSNWRLSDCTLYVTLEPCILCVGAIIQARVSRVVYGAKDPKAGAIESVYQIFEDKKLNHTPTIESGVLENESAVLLKSFFKALRETHLSQ